MSKNTNISIPTSKDTILPLRLVMILVVQLSQVKHEKKQNLHKALQKQKEMLRLDM